VKFPGLLTPSNAIKWCWWRWEILLLLIRFRSGIGECTNHGIMLTHWMRSSSTTNIDPVELADVAIHSHSGHHEALIRALDVGLDSHWPVELVELASRT